MHENLSFSHVGTDQLAKPTALVGSTASLSTAAQSAKPTALVGQIDSSKSAKPTALVGSVDCPVTSLVTSLEKLPNQPNLTFTDVGANLEDWKTPLLRYLCDSSAGINKSVRRSAFKYVLHNDELYRRTTKDFCCLSAWDLIKQEWLWEKFMKVFVVRINRS
jgi:hypothetical protein